MIKIDENFYMTNDNSNWVLNREVKGEVNPETGKQKISKDVWYCGTLDGCIKRYLNEAPKVAESIEELIQVTKSCVEVVKNLNVKL
jgi:hypothetical protein